MNKKDVPPDKETNPADLACQNSIDMLLTRERKMFHQVTDT